MARYRYISRDFFGTSWGSRRFWTLFESKENWFYTGSCIFIWEEKDHKEGCLGFSSFRCSLLLLIFMSCFFFTHRQTDPSTDLPISVGFGAFDGTVLEWACFLVHHLRLRLFSSSRRVGVNVRMLVGWLNWGFSGVSLLLFCVHLFPVPALDGWAVFYFYFS